MITLSGISVSSGIAIGISYVLNKKDIQVPKCPISSPNEEINRFTKALTESKREINVLLSDLRKKGQREEVEILESHISMLNDPELSQQIESYISSHMINAEYAVNSVSGQFINALENLEDDYLRARSQDVREVSTRIIAQLLGIHLNHWNEISKPVIIIANEISVNDIIGIKKEVVLGFVTVKGGVTDHTAILARTYGVPLITGIKNLLTEIKHDDPIIIDGQNGKVFVNPDTPSINKYSGIKAQIDTFQSKALNNSHAPAITTDGHRIHVYANIGDYQSAEFALANGAEGIGLFRTELLFIHSTKLPDEEEQYQIYKNIADLFGDKEIIIRTIDIGADKQVDYLNLSIESNPALGLRAIRLMYSRVEELFKPQVKALLRAAKGKDIKIMIPMISVISEVRKFKELLKECKDELQRDGFETADRISVGIMVEVPSAAILAESFTKEVDFFSIGTNDLTQYTLASDRTNETVISYNEGIQPAVLQLIKRVIDSAHLKGKTVAICGELAADLKAIPLLVGLGIDELSVNPSSIPSVKEVIRKISFTDVKKISERALSSESKEDIDLILKNIILKQ